MVEALKHLRTTLATKKAERDLIATQLRNAEEEWSKAKVAHDDAVIARGILQHCAESAQKNIEKQVAGIVTTTLAAVFEDPYNFVMRFVKRRNKTECDLLFEKDGEEFKPVDSSGGGPLDIASVALRISCWALRRNRPFIALDEPTKWVSSNYHANVSQMFKMLSEKLGLQFLIVSHQPDMIEAADRIFEISNGRLTKIVTPKG